MEVSASPAPLRWQGRTMGAQQAQFGTVSEVPLKPIALAAAGVATKAGTLLALMAGAAPGVPPRGVVRTTWLSGSAVPDFRWAYIASMACTKYTCRGTKRVSKPLK